MFLWDMKSPCLAGKGFSFCPRFRGTRPTTRLFGLLTVLLLLATVALAGCQTQTTGGTITDDLGRQVTINSVPQRIVSLAPSNTEIVYALGLDDRLVGVTDFDNYPEAVKTKTSIGNFYPVDIEKVVSLQPDLILATSMHEKTTIPALEKLGITVIVLEPKTLDAILDDISLIGQATGKVQEAKRLVGELDARIKKITSKTLPLSEQERPRTLYLTWHDPLWTVGVDTAIDDLLKKAGMRNIASDITAYNVINFETVIDRDPQILVVPRGHGDSQDVIYNSVMQEPRFKATEALRKNKVVQIDDDIINRPGPRMVDALEQLAKQAHPDIFGSAQEK